MAGWSAKNATEAFLNTSKMGHKAKEPNVAEYIAALAAGNNAQLMVIACGESTSIDHKIQALVAAAHQTGGRVVCRIPDVEDLHHISQSLLPTNTFHIEYVIGEAEKLLLTHYEEADFVLIDCSIDNHEAILKSLQTKSKQKSIVLVGYNAFVKGPNWWFGGSKTQFLPIGEGLLVTRVTGNATTVGNGARRRSHWIVKVDEGTGEEHVFRVRVPQRKVIEA